MSTAELVIGIAVGYAIFLLFMGVAVMFTRDRIQLRVDYYAGQTRTLEEIEMQRPFDQRILVPLLRSLAKVALRIVPRLDIKTVQRNLNKAGNPGDWTPADFIGVRLLVALMAAALPFALLLLRLGPAPNLIFLTIVSGVLGLYLPVLWLGSKIRDRQKVIRKRLPDALDLLTLSVEAGLSFEHAMGRVAENSDDELARTFGRTLAEMQLGKPRSQALRDMSDNAGVEELNHFVMSLIQADQLGVSIAKVLRIQAEEMRIRRRQRAEEEAHRAPVKMSIVLVLFLLPALFLIILGPAVQRICHLFAPDNPFCGV